MKISFTDWMIQLIDYAKEVNWYVDFESSEEYKEYYDQGLTPEEVIYDERSDY